MIKSKPILSINNLCVNYLTKSSYKNKQQYAVKDVSFSMFQNRSLAIVGNSGCGKTSIAMSVLKLIKPESGQVFFNGKNIHKMHRSELFNFRRQVQPVFQNPDEALDPLMTIEKSIRMALSSNILKSQKRDMIISLLENVGLGQEHLKKYPYQLSGGEKQRVCIARALSTDPKLLILDEPISSLDISNQAKIINLLKDIKEKQNLTFLLITHNPNILKFLIDDVAIMKDGEVLEMSSYNEMILNSQNEFTKRFFRNEIG